MKSKNLFLVAVACIPLCGLPLNSCSTNNATKARTGAIMDFHFDDESNDLYDSVGGKTFSFSNVYSTSPNLSNHDIDLHKDGVKGKSLLFDGYSTYAEIQPDNVSSCTDYLSISCYVAPRAYDWVDRNDMDTTTDIVSKIYYDDSYFAGYSLGYQRDGYVVFKIGAGDQLYSLRTTTSVLDKSRWNYLAATFDGVKGEMHIYLNGQEVIGKTVPAETKIEDAGSSLFIGRNPMNTNSDTGSIQGVVSGLLDEVTIYDRALTPSEVKYAYLDEVAEGFSSISYDDIGLQKYLVDDIDKPKYHGGPTEHWMNEPHAPIYYKGVYHLFFQHQANGPYFNGAKGISWGHLVSTDMVTWTQIQDAITPALETVAPDGIWSGGSTYATVNGIDGVPVLLFTAGDYNYAENGLISNQNIGLATPKDPSDPYLTEWEMDDTLAVEQKNGQGVAGEFRDASLFIEDDTYYMVVGTSKDGAKGTAVLYTAPVTSDLNSLHNFKYVGMLFDYPEQNKDLGSVWELPILQQLTDSNGNLTGKYIFMISPAPATAADNNVYYWIGSFDKENGKFIPDNYGDPSRLDFGPNVFTGPSAFKDPQTGLVTVMSISQDRRSGDTAYPQTGWANNVGLIRQMYLDDSGNLKIVPVTSINNLGTKIVDEENLSIITANAALQGVHSDTYRIKATFSDISGSGKFGIYARSTSDQSEYTLFYADSNCNVYSDNRTNRRNAETNSLVVNGSISKSNEMTIDLFVDRSCLEGFFNYEKTISMRSYPESNDAKYVSLFSDSSVNISKLEVYELGGLS